ncbi:hypothetical protein [Bdellovibrio sp.]|uniref:hypothetical protein n=1 Tax=Bdellovibrio sp. TaxID=28201 RepID=UPI0039E3BC9C
MLLQNRRGSALISAMIIVVTVSVAVTGMMVIEKNIAKGFLNTRNATKLNLAATQLKSILNSPLAYKCTSNSSETATCEIDTTRLSFFENAGVTFDPNPPKVTQKDPAYFHVSTTIKKKSEGDESRVAPIAFEMDVPKTVVLASGLRCPPDKPILKSIDTKNYTIVCEALPQCAATDKRYIQRLDAKTLSPTCAPLPGTISCAKDEYFDQFQWDPADAKAPLKVSCAKRRDPYSVFTVNPSEVPDPALEPQDCEVSYSNSGCNATGCNKGGTITYTFKILKEAKNGGVACPASLTQTFNCTGYCVSCSPPQVRDDASNTCYCSYGTQACGGGSCCCPYNGQIFDTSARSCVCPRGQYLNGSSCEDLPPEKFSLNVEVDMNLNWKVETEVNGVVDPAKTQHFPGSCSLTQNNVILETAPGGGSGSTTVELDVSSCKDVSDECWARLDPVKVLGTVTYTPATDSYTFAPGSLSGLPKGHEGDLGIDKGGNLVIDKYLCNPKPAEAKK